MKLKLYRQDELGIFPLYAVTCDINYTQENIIRPEGFNLNQIFFVKKGEGVFKAGGNTYNITKNDMFYLEAGTPHEYYSLEGELIISYLGFTGPGFDAIKNYYGLGDYGFYRGKNSKAVEKAFIDISTLFELGSELPIFCSSAYTTVITFFEEAMKKEYSPIEKVYNYIQINWSTDISLDELLEIYPYSKSKLCSEFKDTYHATIFEKITQIRLERAKYIIQNDLTLKLRDVAASCGFNDVSYFCKMYKRFWGTSPKKSKKVSE